MRIELAREGEIRLRALGFRIVGGHRQSVAWRLGETHVSRNDGLKHLVLEKFANVFGDLGSQIRSLVVHRQQHAIDVERGVQAGLHPTQSRHQIGEPLEREIFAMKRNEDRLGGDKRVQRQ